MRSVLAVVTLALAMGCAAVPTLEQRQRCIQDTPLLSLHALPQTPHQVIVPLEMSQGNGPVAFLTARSFEGRARSFDLERGTLRAFEGNQIRGISRDARPGREIIFDTSPTTPRPENFCLQNNLLAVRNDDQGFSLCTSRASGAQIIVYKATEADAKLYDFGTCYSVRVRATRVPRQK